MMKHLKTNDLHQIGAGANVAVDGGNNILKFEDGWLSGKINVPARNEWQLMQISIKVVDDSLINKLNPFA